MIRLKRVYEAPGPRDGQRVLVERLWPRGLTKQAAGIDVWLKEVAPSAALRKWFGHEPAKWEEFCKRYRAELDANPDEVSRVREVCAAGPVTFVFAAKDEQRNSAVVLKAYVDG